VVCDGSVALILGNFGDAKFPNLRSKERREHRAPPTQDIDTAPSGRIFSSTGSQRSAVDQADWHSEAETVFLAEVTKRLNNAIQVGDTARVGVIAPPRALGESASSIQRR
jgi:protein required for attachment to host cells